MIILSTEQPRQRYPGDRKWKNGDNPKRKWVSTEQFCALRPVCNGWIGELLPQPHQPFPPFQNIPEGFFEVARVPGVGHIAAGADVGHQKFPSSIKRSMFNPLRITMLYAWESITSVAWTAALPSETLFSAHNSGQRNRSHPYLKA